MTDSAPSPTPEQRKIGSWVAGHIPMLGKVLMGALWALVMALGKFAWAAHEDLNEAKRLSQENAQAIKELQSISRDLMITIKAMEMQRKIANITSDWLNGSSAEAPPLTPRE